MKVSKDFGIVVRRKSLADKSISLDAILKKFNFESYFDESETLISLGPFYGGDSSEACFRALEKLGLSHIDDFFALEGYFPDWCQVEVF